MSLAAAPTTTLPISVMPAIDRRAYPRIAGDRLHIQGPPGLQLLDISPYGARVRGRVSSPVALSLVTGDAQAEVEAEVLESHGDEARLRFTRIDARFQQALFRIARAQLHCDSIRSTFESCRHGPSPGY